MYEKHAPLNAVHDKPPNDYRSKVLVTFSNTTVVKKIIILKSCQQSALNMSKLRYLNFFRVMR